MTVSTDAWITAAVVVTVLLTLALTQASAAFVVLGGTVALLAFGVIGTDEAFSGFSNAAPITVAALYVVAAGVEATGALTPLIQASIGKTGFLRKPLARLTVPAAGASAFLNNTPIMALLIPQVTTWCQRRRISVSKFLIPLSFATIVGGMCTVIGTSTNLVVSGQMQESGLAPIGFFEIGRVGLPIAVITLILIVLLAPIVLPARRSVRDELDEEVRRFTVEMRVVPGGPIDGQTVGAAQLRDLSGVFLTSVDRGDSVVAPVRPQTVLRGGDRLRFAGKAGDVLDISSRRGLESAEMDQVVKLATPGVRYFEAVVGSRSPLVGQTLREIGFRVQYQAAVIGIHRSGHLLDAKLGSVRLRVGDTLILVSDPEFRNRWRDREDFLLIADLEGTPVTMNSRAWIPIVTLLAVIVLAATDLVPIVVGSLVAALIIVGTGVLSAGQARRAVDIEVIVVIAAAFGLAAAMQSSGLAQTIADALTGAFGTWGDRGVLLGIILATTLLTEVVTNNAAALLMLPIGLSAASTTGLDPRGVGIAIAVAASASYLTPIGYQTNTMVYGPGGYRFSDYMRLGIPLSVVMIVTSVIMIPVIW